MITAEQKRASMERIRAMKKMVNEDMPSFAALQLILAMASRQPSPADEMLVMFRVGVEGRDAAAEMLIAMCMTCSAMLALDIMQDEQAKLN